MLSLQLSRDLKAAIEKAISDKARAVILTGNGHTFCSGGDLREMQSIGREQGRIEAFLDEPLKALPRRDPVDPRNADAVYCSRQRRVRRGGD